MTTTPSQPNREWRKHFLDTGTEMLGEDLSVMIAPVSNIIAQALAEQREKCKDAVRKCISPDKDDSPNKLEEARYIYRIDAMDAIDSITKETL